MPLAFERGKRHLFLPLRTICEDWIPDRVWQDTNEAVKEISPMREKKDG